MSITSYFFPISKDKSKQPSSSGSVIRTTPEGKAKSRPTPYPDKIERKSTAESSSSSLNLIERTSTLDFLESDANPDTTSFTTGNHPRYNKLKQIADDTIEAIEQGSYQLAGVTFDLQVAVTQMRQGTEYWSPDAKKLVDWAENRASVSGSMKTKISVSEISTLEGARFIETQLSPAGPKPKIGVLNFASAKKPGGGFLSGASAQEESIARSSTLYYSLITKNGDEFYKIHKRMKYKGKWKHKGKGKGRRESDEEEEEENEDEENEKGNFASIYTHAMIYSPSVSLFRDDTGSWLEPLSVDILTSAAVNAGDLRAKNRTNNATKRAALESRIEAEMKERMARILHLFTLKGVRNLVLGSFGTGVFQNNVELVASLWKELLLGSNAPFEGSFDRVVFAVLGRKTFETFESVFEVDGSESVE